MDQKNEEKQSLLEVENGKYFVATLFDDEEGVYQKVEEGIIRDLKTCIELPFDQMAQLKDFIILEKSGGRNERLMHPLTQEELSQKAKQIASVEIKARAARNAETEAKEEAKVHKAEAEEQEKARHQLAMDIQYEQVERDTHCPEFMDYSCNRGYLINPIKNKLIKTRRLEGVETTPNLPLEDSVDGNETVSVEVEEPTDMERAIVNAEQKQQLSDTQLFNRVREAAAMGEVDVEWVMEELGVSELKAEQLLAALDEDHDIPVEVSDDIEEIQEEITA